MVGDVDLNVKRLLLVGDNDLAAYHPLNAIEGTLVAIMEKEQWHVTVSDDMNVLAGELDDYDTVIVYSDQWAKGERKNETAVAEGLETYLKNGGGILFLHNGISLAKFSRIKKLTGAEFDHHPAMEDLKFSYTGIHPITQGLEAPTINEEPYHFDCNEGVKRQVIMTYAYEGKTMDSGWVVDLSKGRVAYLHPGHNKKVFENGAYQKLLVRTLLWCMKEV